MFFVNLTLRKVHHDPAELDAFLSKGVDPELGLDPVLMDAVDLDWHRALAARLRDAGRTPALHLPFFDLQPGSADSLVLAACRERLRRAMEVARIYQPAHMIGHVRYDPLLYMRSYGPWRKRAVATWKATLAAWPEHAPLFLENTFEFDPSTVAGVVEELAPTGHDDGEGLVALCLDVGHWFSFSEGKDRHNLEAWLDAYGTRLKHLHLHDNDGSFDQHRGMGQGDIDWTAFFNALDQRGLTPTVTFEPHAEDALDATRAFVRAHPEWFARLGVVAP